MIHERTINGNKWTFACHYWETTNKWGHEVRLHRNGYEVAKARIRYYNRTWESYQYRSCMLKAVETLQRKAHEVAIERWKAENDKSRTTTAQKVAIYENDPYCMELRELRDSI